MRLKGGHTLEDLARLAETNIGQRLAELGSPDLEFTVRVGAGGDTPIGALCPIEAIEPGCLTFATERKYLKRAGQAGAVIVTPELAALGVDKPHLVAASPRLAFSALLELAQAPPTLIEGLAPNIRFKDRASCDIASDVVIGDFCYIGANVRLAAGVRVYPLVYIDDNVTIGENTVIKPRVSIFGNTRVGRGVIIHSNVVLGDDGFGYNQVPDPQRGRVRHLKNAHLGGVVIEDFVELGCQVSVDRGMISDTVVGEGTKVDNITQIAHNVTIGRDVITINASFAGSCKVGDRCFVMAAKVRDGVTIGDDAAVLAAANVMNDIPAGRRAWAGYPAQDAADEWRTVALGRRELPRLRKFFRLFEKAASFEELKSLFLAKGKE